MRSYKNVFGLFRFVSEGRSLLMSINY